MHEDIIPTIRSVTIKWSSLLMLISLPYFTYKYIVHVLILHVSITISIYNFAM